MALRLLLEDRHGDNNGGGVLKKEEIYPSYDFQPIRAVGSSSSAVNNTSSTNLDGGARHSWGSADSKIASANLRCSNILESHEMPKVSHEKEKDAYDVATVTEVDRTMKKYADNLLHTLEGVSSRLSQLESRTRHLEKSVDDLKDTISNSSSSTDGKLRQLENILREVQTGVQMLRDKQEIAEAQLQLTKLQQSSTKSDHYQPSTEPSTVSAGQSDSRTQQPNAPPPPPQPPAQQNPPPQFPAQSSQPQLTSIPSLPREQSYYPSQGSQHMQPQPQSQPPMQPPHYQLPQYSQQTPQNLNPSSQLQSPPMPHHQEESAPYMLPPPPPPQSQSYIPNIRQPAPLSQPPPAGGPPQYYGSGQLPFPSSYTAPSGPTFADSYPYSGSPSHYSSTMKPSPYSNSPPASRGGGSGNYSRLPTAKILPQAVPTGQSSGGGNGNRVPVDDVVDKVATMGFSREQVRATVRKLTENGQSVDLNVVLDKLMNGGGGDTIQPQKGWFGR
ncbi:putative uncharacterized protein DDB_G0294196 [Asparagus officinalis]|uniref:putative uncharacterized protein DDB_G0294196 n=1 Tax=Asparagus officinalis TaxID=4686 RepID=UPI00098E1965|nr:putative uncharacterized protein DDB_G0294196 [Asparagus officinalis]